MIKKQNQETTVMVYIADVATFCFVPLYVSLPLELLNNYLKNLVYWIKLICTLRENEEKKINFEEHMVICFSERFCYFSD